MGDGCRPYFCPSRHKYEGRLRRSPAREVLLSAHLLTPFVANLSIIYLRSDKEDNFKHETVVIFDSQGNKEFVSKHRKDVRQNVYKLLFTILYVYRPQIQAGDIIYLHGHRSVPADMLLLHTSLHRDGNQCYVETANIDGETNLKLKEAPAEVKPFITGDEPNVEIFRGRVEFEPANKSIYTFSGALHLDKLENPIALGPMHILLRGSMFANTDWAYGVAIYTGQETKLQMNSRHAPSKLSKIELYANNAIKIIFLANVVLYWPVFLISCLFGI